MGLGIFSFDLAAIINSLSNFIDTETPDSTPLASLETTEEVLQNAAVTDSHIDEVLMTAALSSALTPIIASAENAKKDKPAPSFSAANSPVRTFSVKLDLETRKEIERLIKSLQTSVIHNYKSTDMIDETVSLKIVSNFPRRKFREDFDNKKESVERQKKSEDHKLRLLREELKRAIMKNNSEV